MSVLRYSLTMANKRRRSKKVDEEAAAKARAARQPAEGYISTGSIRAHLPPHLAYRYNNMKPPERGKIIELGFAVFDKSK